ncbi:MAG: hypothetical protein U0Z17_00850 [Bacteroidales bacterium]
MDDDGNGYIDDINGLNFTNNSGSIEPMYHGTHVECTIAANNNGIGGLRCCRRFGQRRWCAYYDRQILGGSHAGNTPLSYVFAADNGL